MTVQALGYLGIRTKSLADWSDYGTKLLGLQRIDRSASSLAFRMDDRKQRIVVDQDGGDGISFFGWEVRDAAALATLAAKLDAAGVKIAHGSRALADERRVKDLIVFADPLGNRVEVFHGAETTSDPFRPGRNISGFRTGPLGMGHVVMNVERVDDVMPFYRDLLGFNLSDYYFKPFTAYFMHVNPRHHSLAFVQSGKNAVHHMMMELFSFDDVGQGYDIAQAEKDRVAVTLGRHTSDYLTSFYSWTPSQFMVEYGWGGRMIETDTWQAYERTEGPSLWGHDRSWLPDEQREAARQRVRELAEAGYRKPVQVMEGNFSRMDGVCPWWDSVKASAVG
jgi:2,3-dihydroxybiphenyl 1,2-dioxygenase